MQISYNENDKSLIIKDDIKTYYLGVKVLLALNLINGSLRIGSALLTEWSFESFFWLGISIITAVLLYVILFKRTTDEIIPIQDIERLTVMNLWVTKRYALQLRDGKKRTLPNLKSDADISFVNSVLA
jgi:hypothetical protein